MTAAHRRAGTRLATTAAALTMLTVVAGCAERPQHQARALPGADPRPATAALEPAPAPASSPANPPADAAAPPAPAGLSAISYSAAPAGFPADPAPMSLERLTEAANPTESIPAYDAPGGRARASFAPTLSGVPLIMPIVRREGSWTAVMLPSANRKIAWIQPGGWQTVALRDQLVVKRSRHELTWYRDGAPQQTWRVTLGTKRTPTPLGRTFVLARSGANGKVYAGVDVLALGNIPEDPSKVATGLRGAHIGIHAWHNSDSLGMDASNGCVRLTKQAQQVLLAEIAPGTEVVVID